MDGVQFIDTRVKKGNEELQYYWLHPTRDYFDYIDTEKALTDKDGIFFIPGFSLKSHFIFLPKIDISLYISKTMSITGALITEEATNMICE